MRFIAPLLGRLIFCLGLMITVVGCVIGSIIGSGGATKACPHCSKRIKHNERQCKHCGGAQA
jgi:hypothetical protein